MMQTNLLAPLIFGALMLILGPLGFFLALSARERLSIAERRIASLEARLRAPSAPAKTTTAAPSPAATPTPARARATPGQKSVEPTTAPKPHVPSTPRAEKPAAGAAGLEAALGADWSVWIGGVALALGALLLVRYSIEQGWFGPAARCVLGLALGAALIAAGEWLRRRETASRNPTQTPAILSAAGAVAGFGAIYAAHGLYGFIGPTLAFAALGALGVATMLAAALHGPWLAGLGLVGAGAAPLLVASAAPDPWPVVLYLAIVQAAAFGLARLRNWDWLAEAAAAGGALWALLLAAAPDRTPRRACPDADRRRGGGALLGLPPAIAAARRRRDASARRPRRRRGSRRRERDAHRARRSDDGDALRDPRRRRARRSLSRLRRRPAADRRSGGGRNIVRLARKSRRAGPDARPHSPPCAPRAGAFSRRRDFRRLDRRRSRHAPPRIGRAPLSAGDCLCLRGGGDAAGRDRDRLSAPRRPTIEPLLRPGRRGDRRRLRRPRPFFPRGRKQCDGDIGARRFRDGRARGSRPRPRLLPRSRNADRRARSLGDGRRLRLGAARHSRPARAHRGARTSGAGAAAAGTAHRRPHARDDADLQLAAARLWRAGARLRRGGAAAAPSGQSRRADVDRRGARHALCRSARLFRDTPRPQRRRYFCARDGPRGAGAARDRVPLVHAGAGRDRPPPAKPDLRYRRAPVRRGGLRLLGRRRDDRRSAAELSSARGRRRSAARLCGAGRGGRAADAPRPRRCAPSGSREPPARCRSRCSFSTPASRRGACSMARNSARNAAPARWKSGPIRRHGSHSACCCSSMASSAASPARASPRRCSSSRRR